MIIDDDNNSLASYPESIPLYVSSIDSRSAPKNGKKAAATGKRAGKKPVVDSPIFLQSKFVFRT